MSAQKEMVLNPETVDRLRDFNSVGVGELIGMYLADARKLVENLRRALREKCPAELRNVAHTLKGSSGNLGAERLAAICRDLEMKGSDGTLDGATRLLRRLVGEFLEVERVLTAEQSR